MDLLKIHRLKLKTGVSAEELLNCIERDLRVAYTLDPEEVQNASGPTSLYGKPANS